MASDCVCFVCVLFVLEYGVVSAVVGIPQNTKHKPTFMLLLLLMLMVVVWEIITFDGNMIICCMLTILPMVYVIFE